MKPALLASRLAALVILALASAFSVGCSGTTSGDVDGQGGVDSVESDTVESDIAESDTAATRDTAAVADTIAPEDTAGPEAPCGLERVRVDLEIPTIDGYALSAFVDRPALDPCPLPTVLIQTPYNKESVWTGMLGDERATRPLFASPFYNYVVVDWRGRFGSSELPHGGEGAWMAQDSYDTVEWIAEQPWSDGKIGTWGVSALCGAQFRTAVGPEATSANPGFDTGPPPHLTAMVPIMCAFRTTYESVYPGGVLRHEWAVGLDVLGFGLRSTYESNPKRNLIWGFLDRVLPAERVNVPALVVAGWWDLLPNGTIAAWRELVADSDPSVRDQHRLLVGPWIHFATGGATTQGAFRPLTEAELAYMDLDRRIDSDSLAFFDHHLRGLDNEAATWAPVRYHHEHEGWQSAESWPPAGGQTRTLYLTADGGLADAAPAEGSLDIPYDPADPSPSIGGGTLSAYNCVGSATPLVCALTPDEDNLLLHGPMPQTALLGRADVALFATPALSAPLSLRGAATVWVDVATTGLDADVAARIVDLDAEGVPRLIGDGIQRLTARDGDDVWAAVTPGERYQIAVGLQKDFAYTVPAGHRLGVMISGSNWPLYARNPSDGAALYAPDAHTSTKDDFTFGFPSTTIAVKGAGAAATHTLFFGAGTRLEVATP